jgi:predicted DsbA family dithiol-disulfide isomerase
MINEPRLVEIVYYTDPLCCWSWAMEKSWSHLQQSYAGSIRTRYVMGGLLPDWKHFHDDVNYVSRPAQMGPVWMEAAHLTQTPIKSTIWIEDPPASSYLSCIAVKCAGLQSAQAEEQYLYALRKAVMEDGINIAFQTTLVQLAAALQRVSPGLLDVAQFAQDLEDGRGLEAFRKDLQEVQQLQVNRFPSFVFKRAGRSSLLITGYRPYEMLAAAMEKMRAADS